MHNEFPEKGRGIKELEAIWHGGGSREGLREGKGRKEGERYFYFPCRSRYC